MITPFIRYSFRSLFLARSGQKLLLLALIGLFLSCFSLLVLHSTMGGLQRSLETRSKRVAGHGELRLKEKSLEFSQHVHQFLKAHKVGHWREYELELLVRRKGHLSPLIIHGIEWDKGVPPYLEGKDISGLVLGADSIQRLQAQRGDQLHLISPAHLDPLLGGIPRQVSDSVSDLVSTDVPEVDAFHGWVRDSLIHNLIQKVEYNKIRLYTHAPKIMAKLQKQYGNKLQYHSWEHINQTLVKALRLETTVIIFLFVAMTLLVAISISSGLFIFYQRIQREMVGFWILGASEKKLTQASQLFIHLMGLATCGLALLTALVFLQVMDSWSPTIMPDIFVDRKIPVHITGTGILLSFLIPYTVAVLFSHLSLSHWKRGQESYLTRLRSLS